MMLTWLQQLFQHVRPTTAGPPQRLTDCAGQSYGVAVTTTASAIDVCVYRGGSRRGHNPVGTMRLTWATPAIIRLVTLHLDPPVRHRGLGTQLLGLTMQYGREQGARRLVATVPRAALAATPQPLGWYARQGFRVTPLGHSQWAAALSLELLAEERRDGLNADPPTDTGCQARPSGARGLIIPVQLRHVPQDRSEVLL